MADKYRKKKRRHTIVLYTVLTSVIIFMVLISMIASFYTEAEAEAYETLHTQTKQIKDDLNLQIKSDMENLTTMANFAARLYATGENYDKMFEAFKPIGLFSRIGILTPDCNFITKDEIVELGDKISFKEQAELGEHITGRTFSYSVPGQQVVRASVPIQAGGTTVGIMYGIIKIEDINEKYKNMAQNLNAQLFVYDKENYNFIIDTIEDTPGQLTSLRAREFKDGYSFDQFITNPNGYSAFTSILTGETLYVHYSTIEDFDWGIMLGRYESQVFEKVHATAWLLLKTFLAIVVVITLYIAFIFGSEKKRSDLAQRASEIRKLLLDVNQQKSNVDEALASIRAFSHGRTSFFVDTDDVNYYNVSQNRYEAQLTPEYRQFINSQLFRYTATLKNKVGSSVLVMRIVPNRHLLKTNIEFYKYMVEHGIDEISFAAIATRNNHVSILGVINPDNRSSVRVLLEDIVVCFSIAIYNKKHLNLTELAATTDSLTGTLNRVSYKKDSVEIENSIPHNLACIYIDVNELHIVNNKFGHAAGDEMLIYIANTLKEVFFGHRVYRMGGDEFVVFTENLSQEAVKKSIDTFVNHLKNTTYNVAIGMSYRKDNPNCEEMVKEAEKIMYEAKAQYYQNKEKAGTTSEQEQKYTQANTGIKEIDAMISVLKEHYNGIYSVSLTNDSARGILTPAYLGYEVDEIQFSKLFTKYIGEFVHPDFHRPVTSFLNYDAIKKQLGEGSVPKISYKKVNGETIVLSVYNLENNGIYDETLWVFSKE